MKRAATYNVHASASLVAQPSVLRYFTQINESLFIRPALQTGSAIVYEEAADILRTYML